MSFSIKIRSRQIFFAVFTLFIAAYRSEAQESSSKPDERAASAPAAAGGPSAVLRDVLSAACTQSQNEFARFLTERSREAFSRLTPAARVALMKRFVLLNEPGKATASTNPAGRPIVRCATSDVTTEMQIGGAELRDNVTFLPMELRNATDTTGTNEHQVTMGLVRENGEWKLLSLGLLLLDLPSLEVEWDAAEMETNERAAIDALKKIAGGAESYRRTYSRLPESLANLGPPLHGEATAQAAGLLDSGLANGMKNGYRFRYVIVGGSSSGAPAKFELAATPLTYGRTGRRSFLRDATGVLRGADRQGGVGSETDSKID